MPGSFDYRVFGLRLRSEIELPELVAEQFSDDPDVTVRLGTVPPCEHRAVESSAEEPGTCFPVAGVANFWIRDGSRIVVEPDAGTPDRNVRLYLLGSAMGILLHQRGLLPLHANAVEIDGRAVAFMGPSGSGKSTLAAWFHDRGFRIIADDVCVVHFDELDRPMVSPGLPRLRLWKEMLEATGRDAAQFDRSYVGDDDWEKFDVPISHHRAPPTAIELAAIYLLAQGAEPSVTALEGVHAAEALFANTYRGQFVPTNGDAQVHWESCLKLVRQTPIFRAVRRWDFEQFEEQSRRILDHARSHGRKRAP